MLRCTFKGRVQGVFFRAMVKEQADFLGLKGQVRNLPDGSVEMLVDLSKKEAEKFLAKIKKEPGRALISEVIVEEVKVNQFFSDFQIVL